MTSQNLRQAYLSSLDRDEAIGYKQALDDLHTSCPAEHNELEAILDKARRRALSRKPLEHHIVVHPNCILAADCGREGYLYQAIQAIVDRIRGESSVSFLVSPNDLAVSDGRRDLNAMKPHCPELYTPENIINTVLIDGGLDHYNKERKGDTGQLSLQMLGRLLEKIGGLHPGDSFRIHGGYWGQCQRHTALQLSHALIGVHVPDEEAREVIGSTLTDSCFTGPFLLPVRYGVSVDFDETSYSSTLTLPDEELVDRLHEILRVNPAGNDLFQLGGNSFDAEKIKAQVRLYLLHLQGTVKVAALFHDSRTHIYTHSGHFNALEGASIEIRKEFEATLAAGLTARGHSSNPNFWWQSTE